MSTLGTHVYGREVKVGDRINFGYPQLGYLEVVAIEAAPHDGQVRHAVMVDGSKRSLFGWQRSYSVARG